VKTQIVDILGKKYQMQLSFKNHELEEINRDINRRLQMLMLEYPNLDKVDILAFHVIELNEKIYSMKKQIASEEERLVKIAKRLISIEEKIKIEIEKLDNKEIIC